MARLKVGANVLVQHGWDVTGFAPSNLVQFKAEVNVIVTNLITDYISDLANKVITRNLFCND